MDRSEDDVQQPADTRGTTPDIEMDKLGKDLGVGKKAGLEEKLDIQLRRSFLGLKDYSDLCGLQLRSRQ